MIKPGTMCDRYKTMMTSTFYKTCNYIVFLVDCHMVRLFHNGQKFNLPRWGQIGGQRPWC